MSKMNKEEILSLIYKYCAERKDWDYSQIIYHVASESNVSYNDVEEIWLQDFEQRKDNIKDFAFLYQIIDILSLGTTLRKINGRAKKYFSHIDKMLLLMSPEKKTNLLNSSPSLTKDEKDPEIKAVLKALDHYCCYYV